jgi:uncharacterized protein YggE
MSDSNTPVNTDKVENTNSQENKSQNKFQDKAKFFSQQTLPLVLILSLIALIVLAIITVFIFWQSNRPTNNLNIQSSIKEKITPDKVLLNFTMTQKGQNVSEMNQEIDQKTTEIINYLTSKGIDKSDIVSRKTSYRDYDYPILEQNSKDQTQMQNVSVNFEVTLENLTDNFELPNQILEEVTKLGVNELGWSNYEISNQREICQEMETKALEQARDLAEKRIKALGGTKIVSIQVSSIYGCENGFARPFYGKDMAVSEGAMSSDMQRPEILTGTQELNIQADINVEYR